MSRAYLENISLKRTSYEFVPKELVERRTLWSLRIIFDLRRSHKFIDKDNYISKESLCYFLQLQKYAEMDSDEYTRKEVLSILWKKKEHLEIKEQMQTAPLLKENLKKLSKNIGLSKVERKLLEFMVILREYNVLEEATDLLDDELNAAQVYESLAVILQISKKEVKKAFSKDSRLVRSALLRIDARTRNSIERKIDLISNSFSQNMLFQKTDNVSELFSDIIKKSVISSLCIKDFNHLREDVKIIVKHLRKAIKDKQKGVNILFYGTPGTGKTELTQVLAKKLHAELFEVSAEDDNEEAASGNERVSAYRAAQVLLEKQKSLLLYDEAEDIFESYQGLFFVKKQENKAWINKMLEINSVPTIWITNNIDSIDKAIIRRFDYVLELPVPPKEKRLAILKHYSLNMINESVLEELSNNENIAPAIVSRALKVAKNTTNSKDSLERIFLRVVDNTLQAQGHQKVSIKSSTLVESLYDPTIVNTKTELKELIKGIAKSQNARICLYGPAGTGKSAYAEYIAKKLKKPLILKKGSDLLSMWVGGTEKNIANAFKEAKEKDAVLVFDEVDSFLQDRIIFVLLKV